MPFSLSITTRQNLSLNAPAEGAVKVAVEKFTEDLLAEAGRLEAALNSSGANPEITSSMIQDAALLLRRGYAKPRKHWGTKVAQVVSAVGGVVTGLLADTEKLKDTSTLVLFVVLAVTTITATVVGVLKE